MCIFKVFLLLHKYNSLEINNQMAKFEAAALFVGNHLKRMQQADCSGFKAGEHYQFLGLIMRTKCTCKYYAQEMYCLCFVIVLHFKIVTLVKNNSIQQIVWFQKISIPPPPLPKDDHWKFQGGGGLKSQTF